jgi:hypothetical protein
VTVAEKVLFKDETEPAATVVVIAGVAVSQYWKPTDTAAFPGAVWVRLPFSVALVVPAFAPLALTAGACAIDTVALVFKFWDQLL